MTPPSHRSRPLARVAVLATAIAGFALLFAPAASAHVKVSGDGVSEGGYGVITFRVPSESATASTVELRITFPSDAPLTSVDTQPKTGWTATVTTAKLPKPVTSEDGSTITDYVSQVDYRVADGYRGIPPGQFDMFNLSVGPFPNQPTMTFAALQTYSDGSTVNWDERSADGSTEPAHPAPVLTLAPAADAGAPVSAAGTPNAAGASDAAASTARVGVTATADSPASGTDWPGIAGLVVAVVALCVAVVALVAIRRPARRADRSE